MKGIAASVGCPLEGRGVSSMAVNTLGFERASRTPREICDGSARLGWRDGVTWCRRIQWRSISNEKVFMWLAAEPDG